MNDIETPPAACVESNTPLCREHYRLALTVAGHLIAEPGQFVHLAPRDSFPEEYRTFSWSNDRPSEAWSARTASPLLRRAFSIAGLAHRANGHVTESRVELMYRVVGAGTRWLESLRPGDALNLLGPLGNAFPMDRNRRHAWLVAGGVGLPPLLWLAERLVGAARDVVAFCGVRSADLLPLAVSDAIQPDREGKRATQCVKEFASIGVPAVIGSDDGSIGRRGSVVEALQAFHRSAGVPGEDLVVYACGPEAMMRAVGDWCGEEGIACRVCMERSMACGIGTCQSCVVPIRAEGESWRYSLCCTEGPVYDAAAVCWDDPRRAIQRV